MHLGVIVAFTLAACLSFVYAQDADVKIVSAAPCSDKVLIAKGVDPAKYKQKVDFDPKNIRLRSKEGSKVSVPGCFNISATNVGVRERLTQLTAEFEMRIEGEADPSKPVLQCKKRAPKCGCGEEDHCMYCDFCKNVKKFVQDGGEVNHRAVHISASQPTSCDCNVAIDTYAFDVEVCTPDEQELGQNVPTEVINAVSDGNAFSLFTIVYLYDFRFNSNSNGDHSQAAKSALKARKARGLVGCYIVGSNVSV